jgi:predicted nucleic acid-binding protein
VSAVGLLLDLNVVLDFLQARQPHARNADLLFAAAGRSQVSLWISGDAPSTLFYVLERALRQAGDAQPSLRAQGMLRTLLAHVAVAPVSKAALERAIDWGMADYEDAVQAACALEAGLGVLVTRDGSGFQDLPPGLLTILSPGETLAALGRDAGPMLAGPPRARTRRSGR